MCNNNHEKIRVVVTIKPGAHPELWADLETIPQSDRSERMRLLATVGEKMLNATTVVANGAMPVAAPKEEPSQTDGFGVATAAGAGFDAEGVWDA